jgi:tRNA-dihydrouridine synthase
LREIVAAVIESGASMLTVHARLRIQAYSQPATWSWLAIAREERDRHARFIPIIGNGGIDNAADVVKMRAETACDGVMIGRAALANPYIFAEAFGAAPATPAQAASFALRYAELVETLRGKRGSLAKMKQLIRWYQAGDLFKHDEAARTMLLRCDDLETVRTWFKQHHGSA